MDNVESVKTSVFVPHPNSLANLMPPWPPGYAPNPKGRPPYSKILEELLPDKDCAETVQRLAKQEDNLNVSLAAIKYRDDRVHGPVPQQVNVAKLTMSIDFSDVQQMMDQLQGDLDTGKGTECSLEDVHDVTCLEGGGGGG